MQGKPRFKKRVPNQDIPKANYERGGGSRLEKPTYSNCGKKYFEKCLAGTSGCFGCGNNDHKVRYRPTIATRGRDVKQ
ncbi:hypothetical protein, partial [Acinetobacter baumannii]|uniref:hypothetical protein n=1 Tax=Acinetobacter baumannii TaxID=470 RepID=UPI00339A00FA